VRERIKRKNVTHVWRNFVSINHHDFNVTFSFFLRYLSTCVEQIESSAPGLSDVVMCVLEILSCGLLPLEGVRGAHIVFACCSLYSTFLFSVLCILNVILHFQEYVLFKTFAPECFSPQSNPWMVLCSLKKVDRTAEVHL
jgi:hypothetical protein